MKCGLAALPLLAALRSCSAAGSALLSFGQDGKEDVIEKVTKLCEDLKVKIQEDGVEEQKSYDKYACWCEDSLGKKAGDISKAKETIDELQNEIVKLKGEQATHEVNIAQLKKDISAAIESQKEATAVREKESEEYHEEKEESEQCIGALEAAIKVLSGAGTGGKSKSLLGESATLQEAQLLSVVAGVRGLLKQSTVERSVSGEDLEVVRHFVDRPEDFVGERTGTLSAAQVANNPYGDYAPQSARITGILKEMYANFASGLEKANAEEGTKQKAFEELMQTKKAELKTLEGTLEQQTMYEATKTKDLANNRVELDATKEQLEADEAFFAQAKDSCKAKAAEWAQRTRMRTEELKGIDNALAILKDEENKKIFQNATTTFIQRSSSFVQLDSDSQTEEAETRNEAYSALKSLATRYQSLSIAEMAATLNSGGHFDKVIQSIDAMIEVLRREEQDDIKEKDWCQGQQYKNKITSEDLEYDLDKIGEELTRADDEKKELQDKVDALGEEINATKKEIDERKTMRAEERGAFVQSVDDDQKAIVLLEEAAEKLKAYYQKNKKPVGLAHRAVKVHKQGKEDPAGDEVEAPPETSWEEGEYKGYSSEAGGLVAIVEMIAEDLKKEIKVARDEDAKAQAIYEADLATMQKTLDAKTESSNSVEKELAELNLKVAGLESAKKHKENGKEGEDERKKTIEKECKWVEEHFEDRKTKRKAEMDGLVEAKNYLAGMDDDEA
jgi:hypothetical protein